MLSITHVVILPTEVVRLSGEPPYFLIFLKWSRTLLCKELNMTNLVEIHICLQAMLLLLKGVVRGCLAHDILQNTHLLSSSTLPVCLLPVFRMKEGKHRIIPIISRAEIEKRTLLTTSKVCLF